MIFRQLFKLSHGKKAWFLNHVNDQYVKKAQIHNFRSRASFKLLQIQQKYKIIQRNTTVLDLGSAPGSWSQAAQFINPQVKIVAVDLLPMKELENVSFYQTDARSYTLHRILKQKYGQFQTIISDMAPNFSGTLFQTHKESMQLNKLCLELCVVLGSSKCNLAMKTIQGQDEKYLMILLEYFFGSVYRFKPKSSRKQSSQHYLICKQLEISKFNRQDLISKLTKLKLSTIKSKKIIKTYFQSQ